tara:strand:+ start:556 stop:753 length:198 start_codon:yes stop_codon:yes gene_type:complete
MASPRKKRMRRYYEQLAREAEEAAKEAAKWVVDDSFLEEPKEEEISAPKAKRKPSKVKKSKSKEK